MNRENIKFYASLIVCIVGISFLTVVFIRHVLFAIMPFLLAWTVAFIARPVAKKISSKVKLPEKLIRCFVALLIVLSVFGIFITLIWQAVGMLWDVLSGIGEGDSFLSVLETFMNPGLSFIGGEGNIPEEMAVHLRDTLKTMLTSLLEGLGSLITAWISNVPGVFIFLIVTVISLFYFSWDLENVNKKVKSVIPEKLFEGAVRIKDRFLEAGLKYIGSYLLMMLVTFGIILVGLLILRVERAPLIALLIAVLDVLPVLGVGTVLVPWSVVQFVFGNHFLGMGLLILFLVNEVIRQVLEPKILGKNLDTHPLVTLFLLYAGYSFFGIKGFILIPFATVILNTLLGKKDTAKIE